MQTERVHTSKGRPRAYFPENLEDLYARWENKEITSADFIRKSGLKKATFYNLLSEYKSILRKREAFMKKQTG